jgi:hypothetical protein
VNYYLYGFLRILIILRLFITLAYLLKNLDGFKILNNFIIYKLFIKILKKDIIFINYKLI